MKRIAVCIVDMRIFYREWNFGLFSILKPRKEFDVRFLLDLEKRHEDFWMIVAYWPFRSDSPAGIRYVVRSKNQALAMADYIVSNATEFYGSIPLYLVQKPDDLIDLDGSLILLREQMEGNEVWAPI